MRNASAALIAWLPTTNYCWRADLITLTLIDGTVYRWTTADLDITYSGHIFSGGPVLSRSIRQGLFPEIDSLEMHLAGTAKLGSVTLGVLTLRNAFDEARIQIDHIIGAWPGDLTVAGTGAAGDGVVAKWFEGRVAGLEPHALDFVLHASGEPETLNQPVPKFPYQVACAHVVYDANCGLSRAAFTLAGTVSATGLVNWLPTTTSALTAKATGYFDLGVLKFTSGANIGERRAVAAGGWAGNAFTLAGLPLPNVPQVGDAFTVYPGCDRKYATCDTKFANLVAIRSFVHLPMPEGKL
jgi:hypothetical protein